MPIDVEFSTPENSNLVENAENATILITQEIESHLPLQSQQLKDPTPGNIRNVFLNLVMSPSDHSQ